MARSNITEQATTSTDSSFNGEVEKTEKKKGSLSTAEARREYQRRYYQLHKEKNTNVSTI